MREGYPDTPYIAANFELIRFKLAQEQMQRIVEDLDNYPRNDATKSSDGLLELIDYRSFYKPAYMPLTDGVAFLWHTKQPLHYNSHQLIITEEGEVSYSCHPYFEDPQVITYSVSLQGFEQVAENNDAVMGLLYAPRAAELTKESD